MSLSKAKIKFIQSLKDKKKRSEHGLFIAEGVKLVADLQGVCRCKFIAALPDLLPLFRKANAEELIEADGTELKKATFLKTAPQVIGVFYQPKYELEETDFHNKLSLIMDGIQDPGNMGTIVRIADWFGIENIICSHDTADIYNPKTIQATMGAIARVKVYYTEIVNFLKLYPSLSIYGTFLEGDNIYQQKLTTSGFIVMGNEGKGIRPETEKLITQKLFIPNYPADAETSESLNVAVATAIICSEFRRRI